MTKHEIANAAARLLGVGERINDLDTDNTATAQVLRDIYPAVLESALASYRWTFARTESAQLAKLATQTADGKNRFQLPADLLAISRVFDANGTEVAFRRDGSSIVVEEAAGDELFVDYIRKVQEGNLPPYFTKALIYQLAADAALALTESPTLAQNWAAYAEREWTRARRVDRQSAGSTSMIDESELSLLSARRG